MRFHVTISNFNTSLRLRQTLESLANQTYSNFDLIIVDACSSDGFGEIIHEYSAIINRVILERDDGLYDGLSKAFSVDRGEGIYCYINAGDIYMPYAFEAVCKAFQYSGCDWLTGLPATRDSCQYLLDVFRPWPYNRFFIQMGFYDGNLLPFIQQESTFWTYKLHSCIDLNKLKRFKLAGDFYLWNLFSRTSSLRILGLVVSSFTRHGSHLSDASVKYNYEMNAILGSSRLFCKVVFWFPVYIVGVIMKAIRIPLYVYSRLAGVIVL